MVALFFVFNPNEKRYIQIVGRKRIEIISIFDWYILLKKSPKVYPPFDEKMI